MQNNGNGKKTLDKPDYKVTIDSNNGNSQKKHDKPLKKVVEQIYTKYDNGAEKSFMKFYHDIFENFTRAKLHWESACVYVSIIRKTIGYNKDVDMISLSQFEEMTYLNKKNILRAIKDLLSRNMIVKIKKTSSCVYSLTPVDTWVDTLRKSITGDTKKDENSITDDAQGYLFPPESITGDTKKDEKSIMGDTAESEKGITGDTERYHNRQKSITGDTKRYHGCHPQKIKDINTKNTRAREGHGLCKVTAKGLTTEEILQHAATHNCNHKGTTCPDADIDDCIVFGKLNLI
ncbi:MAG: replication protein, partial [Nitrospirae bacterium]|nr:replication protein [Nitrospirota bacterium]